MTFSDFLAHTSPFFKELNLLKFIDIVDFHIALFMFRYNRGNLPGNFDGYFNLVCNTDLYGTCAASKTTFSLPLARTNYGLLNIRFCGPKIWNTIDESFKSLSMTCFKKNSKIKSLAFTDIKFSIHRHQIDLLPFDLIIIYTLCWLFASCLFLFCLFFSRVVPCLLVSLMSYCKKVNIKYIWIIFRHPVKHNSFTSYFKVICLV